MNIATNVRWQEAAKIVKMVALLVLLIAALLFPLYSPDLATTSIAVFTLMFAAATTAWNIFSGYTGYIALGHAAFFGTGAYALGIMCQRWHIGPQLLGTSKGDLTVLFLHVSADYAPFVLVPLTGLIAALIAVPLGWIALRTRRHTFIVITIAIFFVFQLLAYNLRGLTHGSAGLELPLPSWTYPFYNFPFYYAMLAILLLALAVSWWVRHSKYGLGLLAIRDDEDRALGLGVNTGPSKLAAFVISAFFVGMLGAVWAYFLGSTFPQSAFDPLFDIAVALMGFMGGMGTLAGPIIGALLLEPTKQYFQFLPALLLPNGGKGGDAGGLYLVIYGGLFLVIMLLLPEGIVPTLGKWWSNRLARRADSAASRATATDQEPLVAVEPTGTGEEVNP